MYGTVEGVGLAGADRGLIMAVYFEEDCSLFGARFTARRLMNRSFS
jgi:hypothetical protein